MDVVELMHPSLFGCSVSRPSGRPRTSYHCPLNQPNASPGRPRTPSLINLLQAQVTQLSAQLEQAQDREARLLSLPEAEQQARHDLEQKLLPAPSRPALPNNSRLILPVILLLSVLVGKSLRGCLAHL